MLMRYILIFLLFFGGTFFLDFSNGLTRLLFALFATGVIWLVQPAKGAKHD